MLDSHMAESIFLFLQEINKPCICRIANHYRTLLNVE
jgi:hypothetical protein